MYDFRKLVVWRKSHDLALGIYRCSQSFPADERFGLTSQLRRSATSIPSNIAEGCGRGGDADFGRFIRIAIGSANELEYQLLLAHDLTYLDGASYAQLAGSCIEVRRMLAALKARLVRSRSSKLEARSQ